MQFNVQLSLKLLVFLMVFGLSTPLLSQTTIDMEMTLPKIESHPYHKPFVAIWLETAEREPITTIAVWYDDAEWLKDLRQWWRKLGREQYANETLDGISGATRKPGVHHIQWQGKVPATEIFFNIEVVREEGGRSYHREAMSLVHAEDYIIAESHEYGEIKVSVKRNQAP